MGKCTVHPNFTGLRLGKKARECQSCVDFYNENQKNGVIEKRSKEKVELAKEVVQEKVEQLLEEKPIEELKIVEKKDDSFELDDAELENLI